MRITSYKKNYLQYCKVEKECCEDSIKSYESAIRKIVNTIGDKEISNIDQYTVLELKEKLMGEVGDARISFLISTFRNFLAYLSDFMELRVYDYTKITIPKVKDKPVEYLTEEDIDSFIEILPEETLADKRFKALVAVLASTGARINEIVELSDNAVDYEKGETTVCGKGGRYRKIYLDERALHYLNVYKKAKKR